MEHSRKIRVVTQRGTFYLNVDGRPDGAPPILPEYLKKRKSCHSQGDCSFSLDDAEVQKLSEEAFLYRLRREYFFKIGDFARSVRDVNIGIQIIELITSHASNPELSLFFLQFRPDQEIFRRTAEAKLAIKQKDYLLARQRIELAASFLREMAHMHPDCFPANWLEKRLKQLKKVYDEIGETWENDLSPLRNSPPTLEEQLHLAIAAEEYERAAKIRDLIRKRDAQSK
jgi:hypothetical protein